MLDIDMKTVDGVLYVALKGRLNNLTSREFARRIEPELKNVRGIVLDMAELDYISSAGLRILLMLQQYMEEAGNEGVSVRDANQLVLDTLEMTGFGDVINIE